ncbi:GntR family transcriptional regulator/MocR family aminotransferase [Pseudomonas koreensis]|uniref:MocR-like pyridoxine biosynthesis transcription factor PdxR n=1 Tax=Pseudomonas koreensis TaxID=198620 RepID=UPI002858387D|nr:PLP-dependent aminotransferase family protein [Pseudomonas koreensis]MDR7052926.1 GntR family transcriptional regulator/MocR family aminotransferase [Pseudomonas koreensis]
MAKFDSKVDTGAEVPVYRQIYLRFRHSIEDGRLLPGERVPSVRALAAELNLARGTVESAYQLLVGEGYLQTRGPAGTVVSTLLKPASLADPVQTKELQRDPLIHSGASPQPLQLGLPAMDVFPRKLWNRLVGKELRTSGVHSLVYPDAQGHYSLRVAIAGYLGISRGVRCTPDQIFICAGYGAALDLIFRSLLTKGDCCWFEDPGYLMARHLLQGAGANLVPIPVDDEGLNVDAGIRLAGDARFAVVTPSHQSPLGVSLSLPRRQALLEWATRQSSWIIEDDYDSEYRYQGRPLPALKSIDKHDRVLYTGTFSKVLAPGLRLSYLVVPEALIARFTQIADFMQNHCPYLFQATTAAFIRDGHFARHLKKMRSLYALRRKLLMTVLERRLSGQIEIDSRPGGMHLLLRLRHDLDDQMIAMSARKLGLPIQPLSSAYQGATPKKGLLVGFTNVSSPELAEHWVDLLVMAFPPSREQR